MDAYCVIAAFESCSLLRCNTVAPRYCCTPVSGLFVYGLYSLASEAEHTAERCVVVLRNLRCTVRKAALLLESVRGAPAAFHHLLTAGPSISSTCKTSRSMCPSCSARCRQQRLPQMLMQLMRQAWMWVPGQCCTLAAGRVLQCSWQMTCRLRQTSSCEPRSL
jgi:hypothetical protein